MTDKHFNLNLSLLLIEYNMFRFIDFGYLLVALYSIQSETFFFKNMEIVSYFPAYRYFNNLSTDISDAGNIWTNGPTMEGIVTYSIITPIICVCGIIGNTLSLIVLSRKELKGSIYVYLAAFVDLCSSILLFIGGLSCGVLYFYEDWPIYDVLLGLPLATIFNTMCVLATIMVTLDRILYLKNPLTCQKPKLCHSYLARRVMVVCSFVAVIVNIPYFFIFELDENKKIITRPFYYSRQYNLYNWIRLITFGVMPSIFLIFGNGYLIYSLRKLKKIYAKCNKSIKCKRPKNYKNLTVVLILIVFIFLISEIPSLLTSRASASTFFFYAQDSNDDCNSESMETARQINTIIYAFSLSSDFVLYYLFCPPFCKVLAKLFRNEKKTCGAVQMNVFVLDKQICFDKNMKSIKELTTEKLFEMMEKRDGILMEETKTNRDTLITFCSNESQ